MRLFWILFPMNVSSLLLYFCLFFLFLFFPCNVVDLLQMLEFNVSVRFPAASLFTVILALCGKSLCQGFFYYILYLSLFSQWSVPWNCSWTMPLNINVLQPICVVCLIECFDTRATNLCLNARESMHADKHQTKILSAHLVHVTMRVPLFFVVVFDGSAIV